jgi:hypothetical protein
VKTKMPAARSPLLVTGLLTFCLVALAALTVAVAGQPLEPQEALRRGNRAYREGRLEEALGTYAAGYRPGRPLLAYNAGTTAHHLERLPEALLWYRRAARDAGRDAADQDEWLRANRELVREQLAAPRHAAPSPWPWLRPAAPWLWVVAAALAWLALGWQWVRRRAVPDRLRRRPLVLLVLAALLLAAGWLLPRVAPRPLVLLAPCDPPVPAPGDDGGRVPSLPAGTETWGRPAGDDPGVYELTTPDGPMRCPAEGVGEVIVLASSG